MKTNRVALGLGLLAAVVVLVGLVAGLSMSGPEQDPVKAAKAYLLVEEPSVDRITRAEVVGRYPGDGVAVRLRVGLRTGASDTILLAGKRTNGVWGFEQAVIRNLPRGEARALIESMPVVQSTYE